MLNRSLAFLFIFCCFLGLSYVFYWKNENTRNFSTIINLDSYKIPPPKKAEGVQSVDKSDLEDIQKQLKDLFDDEIFNFAAPKHNSKINLSKISESEKILKLEKFLKPYHENITSTRNKLLSWMEGTTFNELQSIDNVANGYAEDFFDRIMKVDAINTIVLWGENLEQMRQIIPDDHFPYTSSNCRGLESHAIYGENDGKRFYNVTCSDSLQDLWKPSSLDIVRFGMGLPLNGVNTLRKIWNKPNAVPATYILVIKDAIANSEGDVWVGSTKIVIQRCYQNLKPNFPKRMATATVYKEVFVMTQYFGSAFFHFHVEGLPRLMPHLKWLEENPHIPILISKPKYANAFEGFLNIIKIPRERFIYDRIVKAKVLYMPAGGICGRSALFGTQATSMYLKSRLNAPETKEEPDSVVIIKRSTLDRFWMHHDTIYRQVKAEADKVGLKTVIFGDRPSPTFAEGMKIFAKAVMIVGPHGAGMSNILWSRPGTVIIEGLCDIIPHKVNLCYRNLAQLLGMRWYGIYPGCVRTEADKITPIVSYNLGKYVETLKKGYK